MTNYNGWFLVLKLPGCEWFCVKITYEWLMLNYK